MRISMKTAWLAVLMIVVSLTIVGYGRRTFDNKPVTALAIEVALAKPFYVPAAVPGKYISIVIRVPASSSSADAVTAIKMEPKMDGDKVSVSVFALVGPADNIKTCKDWDALKSTLVGTYTAALDEEVTLTKLRDFGVTIGTDPLTFRVVPRRVLSPLPQNLPDACDECASCGNLICCPNPGQCLGCGSCGQVCCKSGPPEGGH